MVIDGHKLLPVAKCSEGGQRYLCQGKSLCSSHAEMNAIKMIPYQKLVKGRSRLTVAVVRFDPVEAKKGNFILTPSKPCFDCLRTMSGYGIDRILYSTPIGKSIGLVKGSVSSLLVNKDYVVSSGARSNRSSSRSDV